jgi:hypothetical protein
MQIHPVLGKRPNDKVQSKNNMLSRGSNDKFLLRQAKQGPHARPLRGDEKKEGIPSGIPSFQWL